MTEVSRSRHRRARHRRARPRAWTVTAALPLAAIVALQAAAASAQQPVTAADLVGTVMKLSVTNDRVMQRDGRKYPDRYQTEWTIAFEAPDKIRPTFVGTVYGPRSTFKTPPEDGQIHQLGGHKEIGSRGGGWEQWDFNAGALTYARNYESGAFQASFAVTRSDADFACTASASWFKEEGKPTTVMRSFTDNARIEIVSAKQVASSCAISKAAGGEK